MMGFNGSFDGQGHTITKLKITQKWDDIGFFGSSSGAIGGFTLEGNITLSGGGANTVGGVVGYANGGAVSQVISAVQIRNSDGTYKHVGGVVGGIENGETVIKQCLFTGSITLSASIDCIGGILGYSRAGARISHCANLGTVTATESGAYVGGILGYLNNSNPSLKNCYNYGEVKNGGGDHCGAIIGWLRTHSAAKITDNYYLDTSATSAFGSGSNGTTAAAPAKTAAEFKSGEVCYLVNSKTSTGDKAIWKQDIDNGNTPYDTYPLFEAAAVYFRSDGTYSNDPERISITISWGAMEFDYHAGRWDPDTHKYSGGWSPTAADGNDLSVQNNSNVALEASFTFTADAAFTPYSLTGAFNGVADGANRMERGATLSTELSVKSLKPASLETAGGKQKIGTITVRLTTVGGGGD